MKRYLFFLSHVRGADEEWVAMFFRDLCSALAARTGLSQGAVGLRGDPASREPAFDLMRQAGALVALHTPQYATRSYCSAEWEFFRQRREVYWSRTGRPADAVIPVTWVPPAAGSEPAPPWTDALRVAAPAYERDGLLQLLRLGSRYRVVYQQVIQALVDRLAVAQNELPDLPGFAFTGSPAAAADPVGRGRELLDVVVASAASDELPAERRSREFYGASPLDWSPYSPERPRSLVNLVEETAADLDFPSRVVPLDGAAGGTGALSSARERFVVLLVDAWTATLRRQQQLLAELDGRLPGSTAVLEPRSSGDLESAEHTRALDDALDQALPRFRQAGNADQLRRWHLSDAEQFTTALRRALVAAQNDAMKKQANDEPADVPAGSFNSFPQLGRFSA
ncbi:FxsC protein [Streptacidiphilus griseoplanus]|uniref:FxsC protein n=1 Tax=Peterkaempfera griseoplana TaxID=66896 RepID=UPI0012FEFF56|nr:FxsC protein [Peterkaempfera griseoplana]